MKEEFEKLKDEAQIESVENRQGGRVYPLKKREDCTPEELAYQEKVWARPKTMSEKWKQSAKLAGLRKTVNPEAIKKKSLELLKDPNANALQIIALQQFLIESDALTDKDKIGLLKVLTDVHKAIHGQTNNVNVTSQFSDHLQEWVKARNGLKENQASTLPAIQAVVTEVTEITKEEEEVEDFLEPQTDVDGDVKI